MNQIPGSNNIAENNPTPSHGLENSRTNRSEWQVQFYKMSDNTPNSI